jgi:hypothetical protein
MATTQYWSALEVLKQAMGELGLPQLNSVTGITDVQAIQLLSLLNSAGNELVMYYPWAQFVKEWTFPQVAGQGEYPLPDDWLYFRDQTQWDRTDHWPLLGPKSPQEWAWLKGSLVAALPRQRFRVANDMFMLWPIPAAGSSPPPSEVILSMEYIVKNWIIGAGGVPQNMIISDGDILMYNPWLLIKFVKFKFYELKGFATNGVQADFMRIYDSLTGKDVGGQILSLSPRYASQYLGPWSVPDGSWNVTGS